MRSKLIAHFIELITNGVEGEEQGVVEGRLSLGPAGWIYIKVARYIIESA